MVSLFTALFLTGCAPEPASIKFDGEPTVTVHTTDKLAASKASVLDKDGKALETQPTLSWSVTPDTVAKLEGTEIVPVANGEATVTATVGTVKGSYKFVVALPDKLELAGYTAGTPIPAATDITLTAAVKAGDAAVEGVPVTFTSSNEAVAKVDATGKVSAIADGTATITATAGTLTSTVDVTVGAAAATAAATPADPNAAPAAPAAPAEKK